MKNFIFYMPGGGIFSRFFQCGIVPLADIEFDNVYLEVSHFVENPEANEFSNIAVNHIKRHVQNMYGYGIDRPYQHIAEYVLNQKVDQTYSHGGFLPIGTWYDRNNPIEHSARLADYKRVLNKIHINNEIKTRVDNLAKLVNINSRTLGVHVRLTTMTLHKNILPVNYDDYCRAIDAELATGNYDGLYVATDNVESLVKMEQRYGSIIRYYPNLFRLPTEVITTNEEYAWEYDMFFLKRFWQESFMECMTLARCGGMVCRDSNFSNMAVVFSNTINNVRRVVPAYQ
jgi:hypothetical protein